MGVSSKNALAASGSSLRASAMDSATEAGTVKGRGAGGAGGVAVEDDGSAHSASHVSKATLFACALSAADTAGAQAYSEAMWAAAAAAAPQRKPMPFILMGRQICSHLAFSSLSSSIPVMVESVDMSSHVLASSAAVRSSIGVVRFRNQVRPPGADAGRPRIPAHVTKELTRRIA